jgi:hypothetical protein
MTIENEKRNEAGLLPRPFARRYGLGEKSVYNGIRDGSIPAIKVGNRFVILIEEWKRRAGIAESNCDSRS